MIKCHCGYEAEIMRDKATRENLYYIRCTNKDCRFIMGFRDTEEEMIKNWKAQIRLMRGNDE